MRLARRIATVGAAVVLVGAVGLILRSLDAMGLFTEGPAPVPCTGAQTIGNAADTQDMQYDAASNTVFISTASRRPGTPSAQDGIYAYAPGQASAPVKLKGTAADFHPRGISLFRDANESLTLVAINYPIRGNPSIDVFDVAGPAGGGIRLHERESVSGDLLVSPSAVAAVGKDIFYVANAHTSRSKLAVALDQYLVLPWANVVYFDGANFRVAAKGLTSASGITRSSDGSLIYVAESMGRDIQTYARNSFRGWPMSA
jgi:arylesterase/paraoxonase